MPVVPATGRHRKQGSDPRLIPGKIRDPIRKRTSKQKGEGLRAWLKW
jgi:hypothetical protein